MKKVIAMICCLLVFALLCACAQETAKQPENSQTAAAQDSKTPDKGEQTESTTKTETPTATLETIAVQTDSGTPSATVTPPITEEPTTVVQPTEEPSTETPTTETPGPQINELREIFMNDILLVLPDEPGVYLNAQSEVFKTKVERITGVRFLEKGAEEPAEGEPVEEGSPVKKLRFGNTADTPEEYYKKLDTADFALTAADDGLFISFGSDYAAGKAAEKIGELLEAKSLTLPYAGKAPEEEQVKIIRAATFNIQNGAGVGHAFKKLAQAIRNAGVDIVGLQEVDMNTTRVGKKDTLAEISRYLGFEYYEFSKAIAFGGGEYGTAVMSRYPIVSYETIDLPGGGGDEHRSCGHAVIDVDGVLIDFFNTHLTLNDANRPNQWATICKDFLPLERAILTGDLNRDGTEDYDLYFAENYNYVNGNNVIGFDEGCTLVTERAEPEEPDEEVVKRLYALENGQYLEGTYTLTGKVFGVVNIYPDSDIVTVRMKVGELKDMQITCFKLQGGQEIKEGDVITVTGTLRKLVYKNEHTPDVFWCDSCPGWGALDNVISAPFFTQLNYAMDNKRTYSDHYMLWADLAFPRGAGVDTVTEG